MLEKLKRRVDIGDGDDSRDGLLNDYLESAKLDFLNKRYPSSNYPVDEAGEPVVEKRWEGVILDIAEVRYSKRGAEGQVSHFENGINRGYGSADPASAILANVLSVSGLARSR